MFNPSYSGLYESDSITNVSISKDDLSTEGHNIGIKDFSFTNKNIIFFFLLGRFMFNVLIGT